jgi:hypothetical protein
VDLSLLPLIHSSLFHIYIIPSHSHTTVTLTAAHNGHHSSNRTQGYLRPIPETQQPSLPPTPHLPPGPNPRSPSPSLHPLATPPKTTSTRLVGRPTALRMATLLLQHSHHINRQQHFPLLRRCTTSPTDRHRLNPPKLPPCKSQQYLHC